MHLRVKEKVYANANISMDGNSISAEGLYDGEKAAFRSKELNEKWLAISKSDLLKQMGVNESDLEEAKKAVEKALEGSTELVNSVKIDQKTADEIEKRYKDVLMEMAELSFKTGYSIGSTELEKKYLELNGWVKMKQPKWEDGTKFTGKQFCYSFPNIKTAVVSIGSRHLSCIKDGKIWDIWDCSNDKVGIYYVKK